MRVVSESDAIQSLPSLLKEVSTHAVVIREGDEDLGAIVSMEDYEVIRKSKIERLLRTMDDLGAKIRERAAADGLTPDDLMKLLDRKAQ
jgi:hypothetical protein